MISGNTSLVLQPIQHAVEKANKIFANSYLISADLEELREQLILAQDTVIKIQSSEDQPTQNPDPAKVIELSVKITGYLAEISKALAVFNPEVISAQMSELTNHQVRPSAKEKTLLQDTRSEILNFLTLKECLRMAHVSKDWKSAINGASTSEPYLRLFNTNNVRCIYKIKFEPNEKAIPLPKLFAQIKQQSHELKAVETKAVEIVESKIDAVFSESRRGLKSRLPCVLTSTGVAAGEFSLTAWLINLVYSSDLEDWPKLIIAICLSLGYAYICYKTLSSLTNRCWERRPSPLEGLSVAEDRPDPDFGLTRTIAVWWEQKEIAKASKLELGLAEPLLEEDQDQDHKLTNPRKFY